MAFDLTVTNDTGTAPTPGALYLPGEPVELAAWQTSCDLCGHHLATMLDTQGLLYTGSLGAGWHGGVVHLPDSAHVGESMHLRCLLDSVGQGDVLGVAFDAPARDDIEGHPTHRAPLTMSVTGTVVLSGRCA